MIKASLGCFSLLLAHIRRRRFFIAAAIISFRGIVHTFIVDFLRFVGLRREFLYILFLFVRYSLAFIKKSFFVNQYDFVAVFKSI